jgi:hypothetical protein
MLANRLFGTQSISSTYTGPTYVGFTTGGSGGTSITSFSATYPTGTVTGDIAFMFIAGTSLTSPFVGTGWTLMGTTDTSQANINTQISYKTVNITTSQTFSNSISTNVEWILVVVRNCTFNGISFAVSSSSTGFPDPPALSLPYYGFLTFAGVGSSLLLSYTAPTNYTNNGTATNTNKSLGVISSRYLLTGSSLSGHNPTAYSGTGPSTSRSVSYTIGLSQ